MHPQQQQPQKMPIPGVKYLIAVGSGKGGVGKTTVSVNLAIALVTLGQRVGLLDADVYGPNVPLMFGVAQTAFTNINNNIEPIDKYGVRLTSMGFLTPHPAQPLIRRRRQLHQ